jgi:hypothetical protein
VVASSTTARSDCRSLQGTNAGFNYSQATEKQQEVKSLENSRSSVRRLRRTLGLADKWLKDRKGRLLSFDDLQHYRGIIAALAETITIQTEVDAQIRNWPLT